MVCPSKRRHHTWNLDIDRFINPLIPPPWRRLPYIVSHFFGYRPEPPAPTGNLMPIFWAFVGILGSILLIEAVTTHVPAFDTGGKNLIVGSFGAAAVLEFYSIDSPLAQPRNTILGQLIASITGVAVAKLFQLSDDFSQIAWIGGALTCAAATSLMGLTKTIHHPAGATALLAVVNDQLVSLGWLLIPVVMLGCALMLAVALVDNIERRFPLYWWTPQDLRRASSVAHDEEAIGSAPALSRADNERLESHKSSTSDGFSSIVCPPGKSEAGEDDDVDISNNSPAHLPDTATIIEVVIRPGHTCTTPHFSDRRRTPAVGGLRSSPLHWNELRFHAGPGRVM